MPGIKFALGENPKRHAAARTARPAPRAIRARAMGVEYVIRDAFTRAKAYQKDWQDYDRRRRPDENVLPPRRDLQLEPLVEILEGKRLVHAHSYRADEILMLLRLADEFGFKIATLQHVLEGYKVAKEIAAHGAGASTFSDWWGYKIEAVDAIPYNAAIMTRKGVARLDQLRQRGACAPAEHRGGQVDQVGRPDRGRGARAGDDQPGEAAAHRQPRRLARSRQGRRRRRLEPPSAQQLRDRRARLHRRHALLRPRDRGRAHRPTLRRRRRTSSTPSARRAPPDDDQQRPPRLAGRPARSGQSCRDEAIQRPARRLRRRRVRGRATPRSRERRRRLGDHQRADLSGHQAGRSSKGTIVIRGNRIEAVGANVAVPSGAQGDRRRRRRRLSRLHQRAHDDRARRAGRARLRRRQRDPRRSTSSCARTSRTTPTATPSRSRAPTASRPSA